MLISSLIKTSGGSQYYTVLCSTNRHPRLGAPPAQGARRPDAGGARGQARRRAEQRRALGAQRASERGVDGATDPDDAGAEEAEA